MRTGGDGRGGRLLWMTVFAVAMGFLEAAVVIYIRRLHYPGAPLSLFPMKVWEPAELFIEMGREIATLVMLFAAAAAAEMRWERRIAAFLYLFGLWDIFYYLWLKVTIGWPVALMEWDILFLIPWAWLGPWWTPALVALIFVIWGGWVLGSGAVIRFTGGVILCGVTGAALLLTAFLKPAWPLLKAGPEAVSSFEPGAFAWGIYGAGILLVVLCLTRALIPGERRNL